MPSPNFHSRPAPLRDYAAAVEKVKAMQAEETATPGFDSDLKTILLTHGLKTRRAVLWFHGYTSATLLFKPLAELCYQRGYNALVPCFPHHGYRDRFTPEVSKIGALELAWFADEMIDLMEGLGEEVIVGGLSMGGVMTAWAAQERAAVATAILIAPFLGAKVIPAPLTTIAAAGFQILPDKKLWWDPVKKDHYDGPDYGYPWFSTHSLSQILRVGFQVFDFARHKPPAAQKIWVVVNDNDQAVNNGMALRLAETWGKSNTKNVEIFHFPAELGLPHDCISVENPKGNTQVVYEALMRMVG
jgi:pimeloyl-ACP methyl ester carboxylesterase